MNNKIKITLVKSPIGNSKRIKNTLKGLGLRKLNKPVIRQSCLEQIGMINKVKHLVKVEQYDDLTS